MKKKLFNKDGSTLVLLVIVMGAVIIMGISLLNITMTQYKIRRSNSEVKRAFYMAETGLNEAFLRVYDLMNESSDYGLIKADEYLLSFPEDISGAALKYKSSYKQMMVNRAAGAVYSSSNPYTAVNNQVGLTFVSEKLTLKVSSKYIAESGVEKNIAADIVVFVPDYAEAKSNTVDFFLLIKIASINL